MAELRSISDLLEVAIRVERCLLDFYKKMRDQIEHSYGRDQFDSLASEEQTHIVMLRRFLDGIGDNEDGFQLKKGRTKSQNGLVSHAMRVFSRAEEMTRTDDALEALSIGMELEMESIFYFTELHEMFQGEQQDLIAHILKNEKSHLLRLIAMTKKTEF
jgi:rubrerythrin